jgi:hypothetical protein
MSTCDCQARAATYDPLHVANVKNGMVLALARLHCVPFSAAAVRLLEVMAMPTPIVPGSW